VQPQHAVRSAGHQDEVTASLRRSPVRPADPGMYRCDHWRSRASAGAHLLQRHVGNDSGADPVVVPYPVGEGLVDQSLDTLAIPDVGLPLQGSLDEPDHGRDRNATTVEHHPQAGKATYPPRPEAVLGRCPCPGCSPVRIVGSAQAAIQEPGHQLGRFPLRVIGDAARTEHLGMRRRAHPPMLAASGCTASGAAASGSAASGAAPWGAAVSGAAASGAAAWRLARTASVDSAPSMSA
jgi:hypothetical protein